MADLDDFFAKKDKKKSKATKPKFVTAEELVRQLEEAKREAAAAAKLQKATEKAASEKEAAAAAAALLPVVVPTGADGDEVNAAVDAQQAPTVAVVEQQPPVAPVEEEWREFEEEQRKDYSGLKIGQLTMNDDDDDQSPTDGDDDEADSDGNVNVESGGKRSGGGPWKKVIPADEVTQIQMDPIESKPSSKAYISPALRQSQGMSLGSARMKMRNRAAPDITNADYFPTLGAARPEEQRKKKNEPAFEEVRHGGRIQRVQEHTAAPASVTNRFQTLDEDDS